MIPLLLSIIFSFYSAVNLSQNPSNIALKYLIHNLCFLQLKYSYQSSKIFVISLFQ